MFDFLKPNETPSSGNTKSRRHQLQMTFLLSISEIVLPMEIPNLKIKTLN